jgi:NitT/TauT family transport system ATP-binding protein
MIHEMGLQGFEDRYPAQLSGGMRKRAQLARSLVYQPEILLLDEPFAAIDVQRRMLLQRRLLDVYEAMGQTVVLVTHDLDEALLLSDSIVLMGTRPGRVVEEIHVPFERPRDLVHLRENPEFSRLWTRLWTGLHLDEDQP